MARAQTVSQQPYTGYNGQRLANFSPDTNTAFGQIRGIAGAGTPGVDAAIGAAGGISGYEANAFTPQGIPDADLSQYMNPYISNVLDVQKQRLGQSYEEQQAGRDAAAVQAGAFGGDRRFVSDSLARRDMNQQLQGIEAEGLASAFDRATGLFETDESRRLDAAMGNEQNRRAGKQLGLDAAVRTGDLSRLRQDMQLTNAEALSGVGAKIQQREQAGLDTAYKDFTTQRDWPAQQLSLYSQLLSGTPVTPNATTTTTEPAPDFLSQLLGLAVGGAGIFDLLT